MSGEVQVTPEQVARMEQNWAHVSAKLDEMVESARTECAAVVHSATGMSDVSVLFDYVIHQINMAHMDNPDTGRVMTHLMCAAAITRLARMPLQEDPLEKLEKEVSRRDDH